MVIMIDFNKIQLLNLSISILSEVLDENHFWLEAIWELLILFYF